MVRPLSIDIRQRISEALSSPEKTSARSVARRFSVSIATVVRIAQKSRRRESLEPGKIGGYRPSLLVGEVAAYVRSRIASEADITMRALSLELRARGWQVGHDAVWRFVRRQGLSYKKNSCGKGARSPRRGTLPSTVETLSRDD